MAGRMSRKARFILLVGLAVLCGCDNGFLASIISKIRKDDAPPPKLFWTNYVNCVLQRSDLDGSNVETIVDDFTYVQNPFAVAVDTVNYKVYWSASTPFAVNRSNLDGTGIERVVSSGLSSIVRGIAVDASSDALFFSTQSGIYRVPLSSTGLDATGYKLTITSIYAINTPAIAGIDVTATRFFWTDLGDGGNVGLFRQNINGSDPQGLVVLNCVDPRDVVLSDNGDIMYWTDSATGDIYSSSTASPDYDAANHVLVPGTGQPYGISLDSDAGKLYWTDWSTDKIHRSNLDGSGFETLPISGLTDPADVAVFRPRL